MAHPPKSFVLSVIAFCYVAAALRCFLLPDPYVGGAPTWVLLLAGPPALLGWGTRALPWFFGFSLILAICVIGARRRPTLRWVFLAVAVAFWMLGGFLSQVASV